MVEQIARQLAEELVKSEYGQAFIAAKKAYDEDFEAQKMLKDYIDKQNNFQDRLVKGDISDAEKDAYYDEINKLNVAIRQHGTSGALYKAETDFNEYTQSIFGIITSALQNAIAPENAGCSGTCSTCAGCH